jgi:hypothetical protein
VLRLQLTHPQLDRVRVSLIDLPALWRHSCIPLGLAAQLVTERPGRADALARPVLVDAKTKEMKTWIRLCGVEEGQIVMLNRLADLLGSKTHVEGTMLHLCAEFKAKKLGKYATQTQEDYSRYVDVIADEFEAFMAAEATTKEFADFLRERFAVKPNTARKYGALASKLFRYAVSGLGLRQDNPSDHLDLGDFETERHTVLLTHDQVQKIRAAAMYSKARKDTGQRILTASGPMFACIIDMAYLLWARAIDIRTMKESQLEGGQSDSAEQDEEEQRQGGRHRDHARHPECDRPGPRH